MNNVVMTGRLIRDPELRFIAGSGKAVCTFSIAVDRAFSKEKTADFFNIVVWGRTAEHVANYMTKGRLVGIKGTIQNRSYEGKDGGKKYVTEIIADAVEFLDKAPAAEAKSKETYNDEAIAQEWQPLDDDDDVPF
jgi:single-strand DNA-binding protein